MPASRWPTATAWRICTENRWWSAFGKKRGKNGKAGPPVHDDLVVRDFTADAPNQLWLSDITEHRTGEGKLYLLVTWNQYDCSTDMRGGLSRGHGSLGFGCCGVSALVRAVTAALFGVCEDT